jgi:phenylalanyl-tRNA synthetase alpha chain
MTEIQKRIESLSPNEREIVPYLKEGTLEKIRKKVSLDEVSINRALDFLSNKKIIKVNRKEEKIVDLDVNGIHYKKVGLPERRLLDVVSDKKSLSLDDGKKESKLNDNEFKAALGVLKRKKLLELVNGKLIFSGGDKNISEINDEEKFIGKLPIELVKLNEEEKRIFEEFRKRKDIILTSNIINVNFTLSDLGKSLIGMELGGKEMIESVTSDLIKTGNWKGKKFRRYDIESPVPKIYGGKRHFVNQATDYAKRIWLEMGFKEMTGEMVVDGFWNFDALFTAQDHPVREMQDTFFIKDKIGKLPDKKIVDAIKKAHEGGIISKGWQEEWKEDDAKRLLLRTHTTVLSAQFLKKIAEKKEFPAKYFALGKCFRNETVDWSHGFEFNQTEGIVVDENANFRQLLGYLIEFFKKMGYEKIRIRPGYFPYTEPSLEIDIFHPVKKEWLEFGGAGMFRPEVTVPLFGRHVPVLAWGPGFDRIIMEFFGIQDLREMYKNDINALRGRRVWGR